MMGVRRERRIDGQPDNQSGGIDIDAESANIGGDVVGDVMQRINIV
jgi:hypothetical protein